MPATPINSTRNPNLAEAADDNLAIHAGWVPQRLEGMRCADIGGLTVIDSGLNCDTFNFVLRARLDAANTRDRIHTAIDYFQSVDRPFSWWFGPGDRPRDLGARLIEHGLEQAETELAMALDLERIDTSCQAAGDLRIERVRTGAQLRHFAEINAANWTPPDDNVIRFYERAETVLLSDASPLWFYVGYLDDQPVATSELTIGGGVVGLYNISTGQAYRRRGFGTSMTLRPLWDARDAGHKTAILQAAPEGIALYERVGFESFGDITEFKPKGSPS